MYCSVGVVGGAFVLWASLLRNNPAGLLTVFVFPTPLFGVLFSSLIFGELLSAELVVGVLGVALGILVVSLDRRRKALLGSGTNDPRGAGLPGPKTAGTDALPRSAG